MKLTLVTTINNPLGSALVFGKVTRYCLPEGIEPPPEACRLLVRVGAGKRRGHQWPHTPLAESRNRVVGWVTVRAVTPTSGRPLMATCWVTQPMVLAEPVNCGYEPGCSEPSDDLIAGIDDRMRRGGVLPPEEAWSLLEPRREPQHLPTAETVYPPRRDNWRGD